MNTDSKKDLLWHVYTLGILTFPYSAWVAISIGIHTGNFKWTVAGAAVLIGSFFSVRVIIFADSVCKEGNCSIDVREQWIDTSIALSSFLSGGFVALVKPECKGCLYAGAVPIFLILTPLFIRWKPWPKTKQSLYKTAEILLLLTPFLLQFTVSLRLTDDRSLMMLVLTLYAILLLQRDSGYFSYFAMGGLMALMGSGLVGVIMLSPQPTLRLHLIESIIAIPSGAVAFILAGFLERLQRDARKQ